MIAQFLDTKREVFYCIYRIFLRLERCTNIMKHSLYDAEVSYILDFDVCRSSKILPYLT